MEENDQKILDAQKKLVAYAIFCLIYYSGITLARWLQSFVLHAGDQVRIAVGAPNPHPLDRDAQCRSQACENNGGCDREGIRYKSSVKSPYGSPSAVGTLALGLGLSKLKPTFIETIDMLNSTQMKRVAT